MISLFGLRTHGMYASDFFFDASEGAKHAQPTPRRFGSGTHPESIRAVFAATWKRQQPTGNSRQAVEVDWCDADRFAAFCGCRSRAFNFTCVAVGFHPFSQIQFVFAIVSYVNTNSKRRIVIPWTHLRSFARVSLRVLRRKSDLEILAVLVLVNPRRQPHLAAIDFGTAGVFRVLVGLPVFVAAQDSTVRV